MLKSTIRKVILFILIIASITFFTFGCKNRVDKSKGVFTVKWDNFYEGNNIKFYYEDFNSQYLKELDSTYSLSDKVKYEKDEKAKALKLMDWLHTQLEFNKGSLSGKEDAREILESLKSVKKASDKDFAIVYAQILRANQIYSRVGEFKAKDSQFEKKDASFYVVEFWDSSLNKWVMVDVANKALIEENQVPLSALEVINKGVNNLKVVGASNAKKYVSTMKRYFYSYSIPIDNNFIGIKKSNSYVTYMPKEALPELKVLTGYVEPSMFTNSDVLFNIPPTKEYKDDKSDKVPTLVFMKKDPKEDKKDTLTFVTGAFKNSTMISEYYVSINGSEFTKINKYFDFTIKEGKNTLSLSEDGKNIIREVTIQYKK